MQYLEVKVQLPKEHSDPLSEFLDTLQLPGYYEILFDSSEPNLGQGILKDNTNIRCYLNTGDHESELKIRIFLGALCPGEFSLETREIETREYEEAYKEFYKPFNVDSIWIIPIWEKDTALSKSVVEQGQTPLYLNPGVAFGTGHHETTKLLVARLQKIFQPGMRVLDLGTGSGILSLACGLLGAEEIFSLDIDPNAVRAALSNWQENNYPRPCRFTAVESGIDHPQVFSGIYDLVLANITFAVLSQNMDSIAKIQSPWFLFSGVITERKEEFLELLGEKIPGECTDIESLNGWERIEWRRTPTFRG